MASDPLPSKAKLSCHIHPRYKAIRKPRPGCVLCHAMWQDKLVELEQKHKARLCPHGMPLAENICGPCSEGRPNRAVP